jgi:hypothetical protein
MMQSVALTESFYVRDDDFVIVEMPRSMNRRLGSIFDIVGDGMDDSADGSSENGKLDDDDASYDYCDDVTTHEKLIPVMQPTSELNLTSPGVDVNLSFVVNDDDVSSSVGLPSVSDEDNRFAKQEVFGDNMSDLSSSVQDGTSDIEASIDPPTENVATSIVTNENNNCEQDPKSETPEPLPAYVDDEVPYDAHCDVVHDHNSSKNELTEPPEVTSPVMESVEVSLTTKEAIPEKGEKISRLSNKKRRKQLKLAKKAAAAASAVSKLSASSKTKTRRSGKQVAPIEWMDPSRATSH